MISLIPALVSILFTLKTKKLIVSLMAGVVTGVMLLEGSLFGGLEAIGRYLAGVLTAKANAYTLGFLIIFSALAELMKTTGGITGFSAKIEKWAKTERSVLGWSWLLSAVTFFDGTFHRIAVGTIMLPLVEKNNGHKSRFAFILSVTSIQLMMLIPIATGFLGYMVSLISEYVSGNAYWVLVKSMMWNFFSWSMLILAAGVSISGLGFGKIRFGKDRGAEGLSKAHLEKAEIVKKEENIQEFPPRSRNLIIPVIILIVSTLFFFWRTGGGSSKPFLRAVSSADFSLSIFSGALLTLLISGVLYLLQRIRLAEIEAHIVSGGEKVLSLIIVLVLSWVLVKVTQDLGFGGLIDQNMIEGLPRFLIAPIIFAIAGAVSYSIGSSWATWALMMPLASTLSNLTGIDFAMLAGTVWAGGAVSEVISPLAAEVSDISYGEHLVTSLPYVLIGSLMAVIAYMAVGIFL